MRQSEFERMIELADKLRDLMKTASPEQRISAVRYLMVDWCELCGKDEPCHCAPCYDE